jgi:dienelactone hydrolase
VAAVGFSLALSGHRFHDRGATEWFVSNFQEALTTSAHDVQKVIDYLETREDIDTKRIGIFGQGSGAAVAILAAAVDPRIKVLDLEDAWGDWPEWLSKSTIIPEAERAAYLTPAFLKGVEELDPVRHLPKLKIPVRIQYSLPKSAVPPKVRKRMEAALPRQGAHTPVEANFNWIKKQLAEVRSSANSAIAAGSALTASIRGADHTNSRALGRPRRKCSRRSRSALPAATPAAPAAVMCSSVSPSFGIEVSAVRSPSPSNACDNSSAKGPDHSDGYVMRLGVLCAGDDRAAILI